MLTDAELLVAWRDGKQTAGETLFERYFDAVSRFFVNKVPEDPDDLIQETFVACLRGRDRVRQDGSFRSYLFAIACNVLRSHFRRQRPTMPLPDLETASSFELAPGPSTVMHALEEERLLLESLRRIPVELQVVLELHYWENMTTADMAGVLDVPLGTVRGRLRRARMRLTDVLAQMPAEGSTRQRVTNGLDDWGTRLRRTVTARDH
ncbi:MAG: sigma-70 family RNA polymerase sigma factor [Deltaproteobacteria bacterium]|nr:sigma-70 family RNA polymerase sigma factor [Deltaproteobacteria bacterium]